MDYAMRYKGRKMHNDEDIKVGDKMIFIGGYHKEVCGLSELVEILELRADNKYCFRKQSGGTDTTRAGHLRRIPDGLKIDGL